MDSLINLDKQVFSWFNSVVGLNQVLDWVIKIISVYTVYMVPFIMLFFWFYPISLKLREASLEKIRIFLINLFFSVVISWQGIATILGKWINRPRPDTFAGTKEILFHPPSYSFPSDHALFFAFIAAYLYLNGYKKIGNIVLIVTLLVSISRVIGGFHWPGDILAGWILGALLAYLFYLIKKPMEKYIAGPIIGVLKRIKLA
ncbi:MAG: PAP2 superfamily protein [uncultured bacterium]|nr:MAG: PAP2 superfamily protein [uncultured bacterium]